MIIDILLVLILLSIFFIIYVGEKRHKNKDTMEQLRRNNYAAMERMQPLKREDKINRNDLCSCGSGRKYKKCCL